MGPWARSVVAAVAGRAERPSEERLDEVLELTVEVGAIRAVVSGCTVSLVAAPVPPRIWSAMVRFAQNRGQLADAVEGGTQSVHLEHLLAEDWDEPLIPRSSAITHSCTCDEGRACEHIVAMTFAFADGIDHDPGMLLLWRGCVENAPAVAVAPPAPEAEAEPVDLWQGGRLPKPGAVRSLPVGAVLQRLGPSGVRVGEDDLADVLRRAYAALT